MSDANALKALLAHFIEGQIDSHAFQAGYLAQFKCCRQLEASEFDVFDRLFGDADAFTDDATLLNENPDFYLDAQGLKTRARSAAIELAPPGTLAEPLAEASDFSAVFARQRFVALAYAEDTASMTQVTLQLAQLLGPHCIEVCCTGLLATELEDEIDFDIEQRGLLHIATTAITDTHDAEIYAFATARLNNAGLKKIRTTSLEV